MVLAALNDLFHKKQSIHKITEVTKHVLFQMEVLFWVRLNIGYLFIKAHFRW